MKQHGGPSHNKAHVVKRAHEAQNSCVPSGRPSLQPEHPEWNFPPSPRLPPTTRRTNRIKRNDNLSIGIRRKIGAHGRRLRQPIEIARRCGVAIHASPGGHGGTSLLCGSRIIGKICVTEINMTWHETQATTRYIAIDLQYIPADISATSRAAKPLPAPSFSRFDSVSPMASGVSKSGGRFSMLPMRLGRLRRSTTYLIILQQSRIKQRERRRAQGCMTK